MSANFKCYDPLSGRVLFDLSSHTTRMLGMVIDESTQGEINVPTEKIGGGTLFWLLLDDDMIYNGNNGSILMNGQRTDWYTQIRIDINANIIKYQKPKSVKFMYGVYV